MSLDVSGLSPRLASTSLARRRSERLSAAFLVPRPSLTNPVLWTLRNADSRMSSAVRPFSKAHINCKSVPRVYFLLARAIESKFHIINWPPILIVTMLRTFKMEHDLGTTISIALSPGMLGALYLAHLLCLLLNKGHSFTPATTALRVSATSPLTGALRCTTSGPLANSDAVEQEGSPSLACKQRCAHVITFTPQDCQTGQESTLILITTVEKKYALWVAVLEENKV